MTEWKSTVYISASSQRSIAAQHKIVLADGSLCSRQQIVEEEGGEWGGGGRRVPPYAPSPLKQIVPLSASINNVFYSLIYNSVGEQYKCVNFYSCCIIE